MNWNGKELTTIGQLFDAIASVQTKDDASRFMAEYQAENPHATENVGYLIGYGDAQTRERLHSLFGVARTRR